MLIVGVIILSLQDSLIKYMASETSFWQLQFIRSIGNIILLFLIAKLTNGINILFPLKWKPVYLRALTMTTCMFCFFAASPKLSFAQMAAGLYTFPIFVSFFAIIFLKERVGLWRFFALILGWVFFKEWPVDQLFPGALFIVAGGIIIYLRQTNFFKTRERKA